MSFFYQFKVMFIEKGKTLKKTQIALLTISTHNIHIIINMYYILVLRNNILVELTIYSAKIL